MIKSSGKILIITKLNIYLIKIIIKVANTGSMKR